jgi:hypothetical protein
MTSFQAYGDESAGKAFVAYGTVLVRTDCRDSLDQRIAKLKIDYGASATDALHCRVLFAPDARRKSVWSKLSMDDVFSLYSDLVAAVKPSIARAIVALANKAELPEQIPGGPWQHEDKDFIGPMHWAPSWPFRDKQIACLCAQGTMIPISKWPGLDAVTFWPDPDSTLIEFGGGRQQFGRLLSGFIDHGGGQEPPRIEVSYSEVGKPTLLQLADLVAYAAQRAAAAKHDPVDQKFKKLNEAIGAERVRLGTAPDGGIGINIPNSVLELRA